MIPKYFYVIDSIISIILLGLLLKLIPYLSIKIVSIIALVTYVISSTLLNLNKYLYFLSSFLIGILLTTMMTLLLIPFEQDEQIVLWLLYTISWFVILVIIITKKIIVEYLIKKPIPGEKGVIGDKGSTGNAYFLESYPDKTYNEIILNIESFLEQNKKDNNIPITEGEEHLKNNFLKETFRRIVYSQEYGNYLFSTDKSCTYLGENKRICLDKFNRGNLSCNKNSDCSSSSQVNSEMKYREITDYLKNITLDYVKIILRNNCAEEESLKERNLNQFSGETYNYYKNINELYNNKSGHKFIDDYFLNEEFFSTYLVKKNKNFDCKTDNTKYNNPIETIKNIDVSQENIIIKDIDISKYDSDFVELGNPYFWGMGECKK